MGKAPLDRNIRLMMVGRVSAGKTSLSQRVVREELRYRKTQTISVFKSDVNIIDTPGEYLERRMFRGPLMVTSMDADLMVLVQSASDGHTMFPPNFTGMFPRPSVGVVTKCDIADENQIYKAVRYLEMAGAPRIFKVSNVTEEGIREFLDYIDEFEKKLKNPEE